MNQNQIDLTCSFIPETDELRVIHQNDDHFTVLSSNTHDGRRELTSILLTRSQAHELHAWLTAELGLCSPTPVSPLTASVPHKGGAKASRNSRRDVV